MEAEHEAITGVCGDRCVPRHANAGHCAGPGWTVATMASDGSWGSATEPSLGQALTKAIGNCKAMSGREIGCGAQSRAIKGGWVLADRCGDRKIIVADRRLACAD